MPAAPAHTRYWDGGYDDGPQVISEDGLPRDRARDRHTHVLSKACSSGIVTSSEVPPPGGLVISILPPAVSTRSLSR
jgi:hypothetical protein